MKDTCPQCGVVINDKSRKYCDNCGFDLGDTEEKEILEEREFVDGFAHNYPAFKSIFLFVFTIIGLAGLMIVDQNTGLGIVLMVIGFIGGLLIQIGLSLLLKKAMNNYPMKK